MEARQTFILLHKKTFRHMIRVFLKGIDGKVDRRNVTFTTEHKVSEKMRNTNARKISAEFSTSDPILIEAMFMDTGYGKTFVHKDDPEGKKGKKRFSITPLDSKKIALRNLFDKAELDFDESKTVEVLTEEYNIHISALSGVELKSGEAINIPLTIIDINKQREEMIIAAHQTYKEKYGEEIPEDFKNDVGFLSALSDPEWDAKAYIKSKETPEEDSPVVDEGPKTAADYQQLYLDTFGTNVAPAKKNDIAWMKGKIDEKLGNK